MSELTRCNYCNLKEIEARAKKEGKKVTVLPDTDWGMGGVNCYVHPKAVDIRKLLGGEDGPRAKYRVAWFMELTDRCFC